MLKINPNGRRGTTWFDDAFAIFDLGVVDDKELELLAVARVARPVPGSGQVALKALVT